MISGVFIRRPRVAIVIALVTTIAGVLALQRIPVTQYPHITPPTVTVTAVYPGASAAEIAESVGGPIESAVNGVEDMMYLTSTSSNAGMYSLSVTFEVGTDPSMAQVNVQNRLQPVLPRLPAAVTQQGVTARTRSPDFLLAIAVYSPDGSLDEQAVNNVANTAIIDAVSRVPGVGNAEVMGGGDYSMRIWMDAARMTALGVTVDDITDLVSAQRSSAWADVARRIAHEIKNPLTPIQLSAERIRRRFGAAITEDREVFEQCTQTIIRQVGDIGRMVDEFSAFARMPKPDMRTIDLREPLREASFLVEVSRSDITFTRDFGAEPLIGTFDARLLSQAFGNLIKNAAEAIEAAERESGEKGAILIRAALAPEGIVVDVVDNGKGLPRENRQRLLEPYTTTREKGTGLGLAIVRKIVEDHGGRLELHDAPADFHGGRGAMIRIVLPTAQAAGASRNKTEKAENGV